MLINFMKNRNASSGMTLVEMLMVMAIFGVVMMAVMSLFIPAVKSTAVQTQVTDVQSNLRLALNRMTQDLLVASFLVGNGEPIISQSSEEFTIQTAAVGKGFARVESASGTNLTLSNDQMANSFPDGSQVKVFEPVSAKEVAVGVVDYGISGSEDLKLDTITWKNGYAAIAKEMIVIRVQDNTQPSIQTIRYRFDNANNILERIVNGNTQLLARNVSAVNFGYAPAIGRINRVDITLIGQTEAVGSDAISSEKTRELRTSVMLRNVF